MSKFFFDLIVWKEYLTKLGPDRRHYVGTASMIPQSEGGVVDPSMLVVCTMFPFKLSVETARVLIHPA
jgi:hypothetical protein